MALPRPHPLRRAGSSLVERAESAVAPQTAGLRHQNINRAMARQETRHRLGRDSRTDDARLGGEPAGGQAGGGGGGGGESKRPFVAAVARANKGGR